MLKCALPAAPQFIHTLENQREFSARAKVYFASLLTVALHGKLEYYTDIMRTLFLELMEQYVVAKNPKLMLRRFVGVTGGWLGGGYYLTILDGLPTHRGHSTLCSCVHCGGLLESARSWRMRHLFTLRSETVVERMLSNWMSICLYQYLKVSPDPRAGGG